MNKRLERDVRAWLEAEQMGSDELAERALARAFAEVGRRGPRAGFSDRVLLSAGRLSARSRVWRSWWVRGAVAACVFAAGVTVAMLPPLWLPLGHLIARAASSPVFPALWRWIGRSVTAGYASWAVVDDIATALRVALVSREVVLLLVANAAIAAMSLLGLKRLLAAAQAGRPTGG